MNLSCVLDANDILPAICDIAVQATNNTDMQVGIGWHPHVHWFYQVALQYSYEQSLSGKVS